MDALKQQIVTFLELNPSACDALEGISHFWVPNVKMAELRVALEELINENILKSCVIGNRTHYTLCCQPCVKPR